MHSTIDKGANIQQQQQHSSANKKSLWYQTNLHYYYVHSVIIIHVYSMVWYGKYMKTAEDHILSPPPQHYIYP